MLLGFSTCGPSFGEYVTHYHAERNHQGLGNALIVPSHASAIGSGAVRRRARLGGLLSYYHCEAA